ncbi:MAG: tellurite resistance TerB family protein [Rhizobiales bacterium]|nr:tellurite resistance TerB family protein [Hyphomicrobiales bacterium]
MPLPTPHEAIIYLMVITSAADRDMTDLELSRIGEVVKSWPIFADFDPDRLVAVARDCQALLQKPGSLNKMLTDAARAIPVHLHDTAYAAAFEVAAVDLEMRMEEARVLQMLRAHLEAEPEVFGAVERAAKARHRTLT